MSPHAVNNFVSDLVLMAQAMERLPQVEHDLVEAQREIARVASDKAQIEADLEQSRTYAASLEAKVRETEASRDDAELRFLELDERASKALNWLADIESATKGIRSRLELPQPEPVISEVKPIAADPTVDTHTIQPSHDSLSQSVNVEQSALPPQGQSEADPTLASTTKAETEGSMASVNDTATHSDTASGEHSPGPYHGKTYSEVTRDDNNYISFHDWKTGGGSSENWYK